MVPMKYLIPVLLILGCGQSSLLENQAEELKEIPVVVPEALPEPKKPTGSPIGSPAEAALAPAESVRVVFFTAKWCSFCPVTKGHAQAACKAAGVRMIESDTDKYPDYSSKWGVDLVPTILVTVDGKERWRYEGTISESRISAAIAASRRTTPWELGELKQAIAAYAKSRSLGERYRVNGMTVFQHLTRDHKWDGPLVQQLTEDQQHWLHDATHYGAILP